MVRLASTILPTVKRLYCLLSGFWTKTFSSSSGSLWVVSTIVVGLSGFAFSSGSLSLGYFNQICGSFCVLIQSGGSFLRGSTSGSF